MFFATTKSLEEYECKGFDSEIERAEMWAILRRADLAEGDL